MIYLFYVTTYEENTWTTRYHTDMYRYIPFSFLAFRMPRFSVEKIPEEED